ncbi:hypothetical protein [Escherichia coli]
MYKLIVLNNTWLIMRK